MSAGALVGVVPGFDAGERQADRIQPVNCGKISGTLDRAFLRRGQSNTGHRLFRQGCNGRYAFAAKHRRQFSIKARLH
ncbi:hypothetical protein [Pararhodobacter marinus]|uniref:hypothetical protein n=1 Tax=Pararhodobacter marinus TaxID=2184063 RepID=UPI0011B21D37|nr:hypothetical protein [Pararhodobacter marinus]